MSKRKATQVIVQEDLLNDVGMKFTCDSCFKDISHIVLIQCAECEDLDLCLECFGSGVELSSHKATHAYRVLRPLDFPLFTENWRADEEILLIEGCEQFGIGNWKDIAEHIGSKDAAACEEHYLKLYTNWTGAPLPNSDLTINFSANERPAILMPNKVAPVSVKKSKKDDSVHEPTPTSLQSIPSNHEIAGYMPGRREFETENENEAELALKDLQFSEEDLAFDINLKLSMLEIYSGVLQRRMAKKQFVFDHGLLEFRRQQAVDKMRSKEDRDVFQQIKPYARFMNSEVFDQFLSGLVREEELRRKNQMLQEYRRHGLRTFAEVSRFEAEKKHLELYLKGGSSLARNPLPAKEPFALPAVSHAHNSPSEPSYNDFRPSNASAGGGRRLGTPLNISNAEGAEMLSEKERQICSILRLYPRLYLSIKDTLIREYLKCGGLKRAQARAALKIDVNKTSRLYDFFVSAGWIKPPASGE